MENIRTIDVSFGDISKDYKIEIGRNITKRLTDVIKTTACQRLMIITDETVASYYLNSIREELSTLAVEQHSYIIVAGESSKTLDEASEIYSELARHAFSRSDLIIAFGGGVVGDLAGYVAATYKRGISFIQVPTTLLAQVDSSVGGKVAVNIPEGKNLVGAFYQPKYVLVDTSFLETLTDDQWLDGLGEIIKYGLIGDATLYTLLENHTLVTLKNIISEIIERCCEIKKNVVLVDEFDTGIRMTLNFGHTLGHAIEKYYGFGKYTHGQAVAMGMYLIMRQYELYLQLPPDMSLRIETILRQYDLFRLEMIQPYKAFCTDVFNDKKVFGNKINLIVVDKIGKATIYPLSISDSKVLLLMEDKKGEDNG